MSEKRFVHVVSDGTPAGTEVLLPNGERVPGVCGVRVQIDAMQPGLVVVELNVYATLDVKGELKVEGAMRRICLDKMTPAERAVYDAMQAVEALPADVRLTRAMVLLEQARNNVADFVDLGGAQ